jgi:hypothetical protein
MNEIWNEEEREAKLLEWLEKNKPRAWEEELYPSCVKMVQDREDSKVPPDWDSDPRTLGSALYPSMRRKPA